MLAIGLLIGYMQFLDPPPMVETLDCGLRVVAIEDRSVPLVSVQLLINAGGDIDPPSQPGLMAAVHAVLIDAADADQRLRAYALEPQNTITPDVCGFQTVLPPPLLPDVLKIEADRLDVGDGRALIAAASGAASHPVSQPTSDETSQPTSRLTSAPMSALTSAPTSAPRSLAETIRAARRRPAAYVPSLDESALARLMAGTPYARPAGTIGDWLEKPGADVAIREALTRWVTPGNCVLMIVGDVSAPQAIGLARERFAKLKWAESPRKPWPEPPAAERIDLTTPGGEGVRMAFLTGGYSSFEHAAIRVLMKYFESWMSELPWADCELGRYRDAGWISFSSNDATEADVRAALAKIADEGLPPEVLLSARGGAAADLRAAIMKFDDHADAFAVAETLGGDAQIAAFELARVGRVSMSEVRMAARYLLSARCVVQSDSVPTTAPSDAEPGPEPTIVPARKRRADVGFDDRPLAIVMADLRLPVLDRSGQTVLNGVELVTAANTSARFCAVFTDIAEDRGMYRGWGTTLEMRERIPVAYEPTHEIVGIGAISRWRADMCEVEHIGPRNSADRIIEVQFDELRSIDPSDDQRFQLPGPIRVCAWGAFDRDELAASFRELLDELRLEVTPPVADANRDGFKFERLTGTDASIELRVIHDSLSPLRAATHEIGRSVGDHVSSPWFWVHPDWSYHLTTRTISFRRVCDAKDAPHELTVALDALRARRESESGDRSPNDVSKVAAWLAWNEPSNVLDELAARGPGGVSARELLAAARVEVDIAGPAHLEQTLRDLWQAWTQPR